MRPFAHRALLASTLLALSACGGSGGTTETLTCDPKCPTGTHCAATGCVLDGDPMARPDAGVPDLAGCEPACAGLTPYCNASHQCVPCLEDANCPAGYQCKAAGQGTACVAGCTATAQCQGNGAPASMDCCGGRCVDTATDVSNCGGCGTACNPSHAAATCTQGACGPGACAAGWGDCNSDPTDGCEANIAVDPANCGSCGAGCKIANAIPACANTCYVGACNFGFDDCNGKPEDGCETSVVSDAKNCGACGNSCPPVPHAKVVCNNASCQLSTCDLGYGDCNGNALDGCEVNLFTSNNNCGACGATCNQGLVCKNGGCTCPQCNFPNATSKCVNNVCQLDMCNAGFHDCDGDPGNGCEAAPGFVDCDGDPKNGCETDTNKDKMNCGVCGTMCDGKTPACSGGVCVGGVMWVFGDYKGPGTMWDAKNQWNGTVDCPGTCGAVNMTAVGVRFICNLAGQGPTEGCDQMNDGDYGRANCDVWYDMGVKKILNNGEDCAGGRLFDCIAGKCTEQVTYHAIQCQCTP